MMALGLSLEQVVPMVTSNPADMLGLAGVIGTLRSGVEADVTVLNAMPGRYILRDNEKTEVVADSLLQPVFCLRAGARHDATAPILPRAVAA
jgi:dihydroorotase